MTNLDALAEQAGCTVRPVWSEAEQTHLFVVLDERGREIGGAPLDREDAAAELRMRRLT